MRAGSTVSLVSLPVNHPTGVGAIFSPNSRTLTLPIGHGLTTLFGMGPALQGKRLKSFNGPAEVLP